ncbi:hypothetical protein OS493_014851 [Desmophyllum pertusum]|uniref:Alpha-L-arabinofuranosidase B arabinose-binding domain-containing protein n=1 Tax=Desmophyllum pertusum TaxID=174260 RepID=A0A9W9YDG7_9CNID|nr:hypothetical protein OS493_014851 [Desmophyllum pertusum]
MARKIVWRQGGASKLVQDGLYTVHSWDVPYPQENGSLNFCWRSLNGKMTLWSFCQVFILRIPALYKKIKAIDESVSFESACLPGFFLRQKNYRFILDKRDGSELFDKESSFKVYSVMKFSRSFLLQSMHNDWYICQSKEKHLHRPTIIELDFYNGEPDVLERCTFSFQPTAQHDNKYKNCKNVVGPVVHPAIRGQSLPHPPHLVPKKPSPLVPAQPTCIPVCPAGTVGGTPGTQAASGSTIPSLPLEPSIVRSEKTCVALNFINNFGPKFKLSSSLKHEAYLVTGSGFKLKLIIDRPELHSHVTFYAEDEDGSRKLLLNGQSSISEPAVSRCPVFLDVSVTSEKGNAPPVPSGKFPAVTSSAHASSIPSSSLHFPAFPKIPPPHHHPPPHPPLPPPPPSPPSLPRPPPSLSPLSFSPPTPSPSSASQRAPPAAPPSISSPPSVGPASPAVSLPRAPSQNGNGYGSIHYHYHLPSAKKPLVTSTCPSSCTTPVPGCLHSCPPHCCK